MKRCTRCQQTCDAPWTCLRFVGGRLVEQVRSPCCGAGLEEGGAAPAPGPPSSLAAAAMAATPSPAPSPPAGPPATAPGPFSAQVEALLALLQRIEEEFDLDELDRVAHRYARTPGPGALEALRALAHCVRRQPDCFRWTDLSLDPARLLQMADRKAALDRIQAPLARLSWLVSETRTEIDDEIVEVLRVGLGRLPALLLRGDGDPRLAEAIGTLLRYRAAGPGA